MADPIATTHLHRAFLKRFGQGRMYPFYEYHSFDTFKWFEDFDSAVIVGGEAIEGDGTLLSKYQSTASGANSVAAAINTGTVNGVMRLDTGDANDGRSDFSSGLNWQGQLSAVVAARLKINTVATSKVEFGLTDVLSGTDAGAINVLGNTSTAATFNATDGVYWAQDSDAGTSQWQCVGVDTGAVATKIDPGSAQTPADDTYETFYIALRESATTGAAQAKFFHGDANGNINYESAWMADAVTSTVNLTPWIFAQTRTTADRYVDVDWVAAWQRRTTS